MRIYPTRVFYGRQHELALLTDAIRSRRAELGFVYGRRRVGKSTLLAEVGGRRGDLYFEGLQQASGREQVEHFMSQLAAQTATPKAVATSWRDVFDVLSFRIKRGRHYVVFDEFPWMAAGRTELVSLFKYFWDNHWKKNPNITMVLCGSIAQFMIKHIVHSEALHNRKTFEIKVDPLPAREAKLFFAGYQPDLEIARFLMVFGGIPKYLEQIDPTRSLAANLDRLCFQKNGYFLTEFDSIFKEQFKVAKTYEGIVRTLAEQAYSTEALAQRLGKVPGGGWSSYVRTLEQADFVEVFAPLSLNGAGDKTQRVVLWDEWLRFFFNYVDPHKRAIQLNTKRGMFRRLVARTFDTWCGLAFERLCIKNLPAILTRLKIDAADVRDFGPFFRQPSRSRREGKGEGLQIDILVRRDGDLLTLIECKFRTRPIGVSIVEEVERKVKLLNAAKRFSVERVLISAGGISRELERRGYFHQIVGLDALFTT